MTVVWTIISLPECMRECLIRICFSFMLLYRPHRTLFYSRQRSSGSIYVQAHAHKQTQAHAHTYRLIRICFGRRELIIFLFFCRRHLSSTRSRKIHSPVGVFRWPKIFGGRSISCAGGSHIIHIEMSILNPRFSGPVFSVYTLSGLCKHKNDLNAYV